MDLMTIRARTTIPSSLFPKDNRPTLHQGDKGDLLPFEALAMIQAGNLDPPP